MPRSLAGAALVALALIALGAAFYALDPTTIITAAGAAGERAASPEEAFEAGRQAGATVRLVGYGAGLLALIAATLGGYALRGEQ